MSQTDQGAVLRAANVLVQARRSGSPTGSLDPALRPATIHDALRIQDAVTDRIGEAVLGWKVHVLSGGEVARGALLRSLFWQSPAVLPASRMPTVGVEGEIAFMLLDDLPPQEAAYDRQDVLRRVSPLIAIEVVGSRFGNIRELTFEELTADHLANAGFVQGTTRAGWNGESLSDLEMLLAVDGQVVCRKRGGHPAVDPLLPLIALANLLRSGRGLRAGEVVTTGSPSGVVPLQPGQSVKVLVEGIGSAEATAERPTTTPCQLER